jgi:hypothetical protein
MLDTKITPEVFEKEISMCQKLYKERFFREYYG